MSRIQSQLTYGYSASAPTEKAMTLWRGDVPFNNSHAGILCIHGHGADATFMSPSAKPSWPNIGYHAWSLALNGYIMYSVDAAGATAWTDAAEMARIDDAYAAMMAICKPSKIGIMAWSMGGAATLNWIKRNPTKVAAAFLFNAASDLDFFNATAGYVPSYNTNGVALGAYASEIQADFNPYNTASVGYRIHDEPASWRGIGVPITMAHTLDDSTIPYEQTNSFVQAVNDPLVKVRTVQSGGHGGSFAGIPSEETTQFFKANL